MNKNLIVSVTIPDLVASGNRIVSVTEHDASLVKHAAAPIVVAQNYHMQTNSTGVYPVYFRLSGTAAPMVNGAAGIQHLSGWSLSAAWGASAPSAASNNPGFDSIWTDRSQWGTATVMTE